MTRHLISQYAPIFLILLLFVAIETEIRSQSLNMIRGKIVNAQNSDPVPFATVFLKDHKSGIYANAEGDFSVPDDSRFCGDSLIVTSIGFRRTAVFYSDLADNEVNRIKLSPTEYKLSEVKILSSRKKLKPEEIVKHAIKKISSNYSQEPFSYVAYYRDYLKRENTYYNLNEALVQAWDIGFRRKTVFNDYSLMELKKNSEFSTVPVAVNYDNTVKVIPGATLSDQGGNELLILLIHDAIRNNNIGTYSFVNTFRYDFVKNHVFANVIPVMDNNMMLYKIPFRAARWMTLDSLIIEGNIYIQPVTYAIYRLDYSTIYNSKKDKGKRMFSISTEYGREHIGEEKLRLKYISFNNTFSVNDTAGNSYFRLKRCFRSDPYDFSRFYFEFNNNVDQKSAFNPLNYSIMFGQDETEIRKISVNRNLVVVTVDPGLVSKGACLAEVKGIYDVDGRLLNEMKKIDYFQYRELFVQEYVQSSSSSGRCLMLNKPLELNCISPQSDMSKYWMNTPVRKEE